MKLIADSGSTKTDWCVCNHREILYRIQTEGINPFHQSEKEISNIINNLYPLLYEYKIDFIEFYGAGCALPEKQVIIKNALARLFGQADIEIESDLLGAARALCQNQAGIACILGTGSNSCEYDGQKIISNTPSLGYILGDEGSGATLGKQLVNSCLKKQLPDYLCSEFMEQFQLTQASLLDRIYRQPLANRFLANLSPFLLSHREEPTIHTLLINCFKDFFSRNILQYNTSLPVHLTGSIAYFYKSEIEITAQSYGLTIGHILKSPIEGLANFIRPIDETC